MPTLSLNAVTNLSNVPRQPNTHKKVKRGLTKQHTKGKHLLQRWAGLISGQREATRADGSSRVRPILALSLRDSACEKWANKGPWTLNDRLGEWSRPGTVHTESTLLSSGGVIELEQRLFDLVVSSFKPECLLCIGSQVRGVERASTWPGIDGMELKRKKWTEGGRINTF